MVNENVSFESRFKFKVVMKMLYNERFQDSFGLQCDP